MIPALFVCLALVALLAYRERGVRRELARSRAETAAARAETAEERQRAAEERRELYQRIQAPEIAVADAHRERRGPYRRRQPIGADDDAAFAEAREGSRSEVASG